MSVKNVQQVSNTTLQQLSQALSKAGAVGGVGDGGVERGDWVTSCCLLCHYLFILALYVIMYNKVVLQSWGGGQGHSVTVGAECFSCFSCFPLLHPQNQSACRNSVTMSRLLTLPQPQS